MGGPGEEVETTQTLALLKRCLRFLLRLTRPTRLAAGAARSIARAHIPLGLLSICVSPFIRAFMSVGNTEKHSFTLLQHLV